MSSEETHNPSSGGKVTVLSPQICVGCDTQKAAGDKCRDYMAQHSLEADETLFRQDIGSTCAYGKAQAWGSHRPSGPFGDKDQLSGEFLE